VPEVLFDILREGSINQLSDERTVDWELIGVESGHPDILASEALRSHWILTVVTRTRCALLAGRNPHFPRQIRAYRGRRCFVVKA
jgi:hypothetical protein